MAVSSPLLPWALDPWDNTRGDAPFRVTPPQEVAGINEECLGMTRGTREDEVAQLRRCCEDDIFLCWDVVHTFDRCCYLPRGPDSRLENITGVHFVTYGSRHFAKRAHVLSQEALRTGWFNTVKPYTPSDLGAEFLAAHRRFLRRKARLGGYGLWKAHIILQRLSTLQEGDIVFYLDAGCELNELVGSRFLDYVRAAEQSPLGLFTFASSLGPQGLYTKGDLVEHVRPHFQSSGELERALMAPQHITGMIWVRKCAEAIHFLEVWGAIMGGNGYRMIDDSPSIARNFTGFKEHRHDQSVFSMMLYASGHRYYVRDESLPQAWQRHLAPIRASRLCGARHYLTADPEEWARAGCIEEPGYMPPWAKDMQTAAAV